MSYKHLSPEERYYLEIEKKSGKSSNAIASALGRSQTTISRELKRNTGKRGYRHQQATRLAQERHQEKHKATKMTDSVKRQLRLYIEQDWSPEQIAGRLKRENMVSLHHETIYQYILVDKQSGGELFKHLRHQNKTYLIGDNYPVRSRVN